MQLSIIALLATASLATARGLPSNREMLAADGGLFRRTTCDADPTGTSSANDTAPIASPGASSAADCQDECDGTQDCQSFAFGTTRSASDTECLLYSVAAEEIPSSADGADLKAYDRTCQDVSTTAPVTTATAAGAGSGGDKKTKKVRRAHKRAEAKRANKIKKSIRNAATAARRGAKMTRDTCGTAPSGSGGSSSSSSSQDATPAHTIINVDSAKDCLAKCKQTSGCKSIEYGKTSTDGQNECLLYELAVAQLPAPTSGQKLVAYDVGCSS